MFSILFLLGVLLSATCALILSPVWLVNGKPKTKRQHKAAITGFWLMILANICAWAYELLPVMT